MFKSCLEHTELLYRNTTILYIDPAPPQITPDADDHRRTNSNNCTQTPRLRSRHHRLRRALSDLQASHRHLLPPAVPPCGHVTAA